MNNAAKFTPGPWEITDQDNDSFRIGSIDFGGIALVHDSIAGETGRMGELEANARLIARAAISRATGSGK